jgi:hypothetical protein
MNVREEAGISQTFHTFGATEAISVGTWLPTSVGRQEKQYINKLTETCE